MTTAQASNLPWTFRFAETTRAPLPLVALGVAAAYMGIFLLLHNAAGGMNGLRMIDGRFFWLNPLGLMAFSYSLHFGFLLIIGGYALRAASKNFAELRPLLRFEPGDEERFATRLRRIDPWRLRLVGAASVVILEAFDAWFFWNADPGIRPQPWGWWVAFLMTQDVVIAWLGFRALAVFYEMAQRFSQLGEYHVSIDLFDFQGIRPFTRMGLRLALLLVIAFAIITPTFAPLANVGTGVALSYGTFMCLPLFFGAILVIVTVRGVHRAIVKAKAVELDRVHAEIAREREAALGAEDSRKSVAAQRLPGLLAYEARVEQVRDWPLDLPVLLRFGFYVLILLSSWVAGALVERALGIALD